MGTSAVHPTSYWRLQNKYCFSAKGGITTHGVQGATANPALLGVPVRRGKGHTSRTSQKNRHQQVTTGSRARWRVGWGGAVRRRAYLRSRRRPRAQWWRRSGRRRAQTPAPSARTACTPPPCSCKPVFVKVRPFSYDPSINALTLSSKSLTQERGQRKPGAQQLPTVPHKTRGGKKEKRLGFGGIAAAVAHLAGAAGVQQHRLAGAHEAKER